MAETTFFRPGGNGPEATAWRRGALTIRSSDVTAFTRCSCSATSHALPASGAAASAALGSQYASIQSRAWHVSCFSEMSPICDAVMESSMTRGPSSRRHTKSEFGFMSKCASALSGAMLCLPIPLHVS